MNPSKRTVLSKVNTISTPFLTASILSLVLLGGCSFGQPSQQSDAAPIELDTYESPSANGNAAASATNNQEATTAAASASGQTAEGSGEDSEQTAAASTTTGSQSDGQQTDARQSIPLLSQNSYNGEIEPDETVTVMAEVSGKVLEVLVEEGDSVVAGQPLVRVDGSVLEAQQAQAVAGLKAAQAQLDLLLVEADADTVQAAEAAVNAASVAYREALNGASAEDITIAEAQVRQAQAAVDVAQAAYNQVKGNPRIAMMPQSQQLQQATFGLEAAQAQFQKVLNGAPDDAIAGAYANLVQAQTQLANLQEGAKPEQIRAVEAQIEQAEAGLYLSSIQVSKTTVAAPIDGVVMSKNVAVGSMASPGAPVAMVMSNDVNVTIPVEESRMAQLAIGQPATIRVNAYPGQVFEGEIIRIAPQLDPATRTVSVTIRPTNDDENRLVPGMFATVDLLN